MADKSNNKHGLNRRKLLGLVGSGTAGAMFSTGYAAGRGRGRGEKSSSRGVGPCTCPEPCPDETFCGKIEGAPKEGRTYTFTSGEDQYSVTIDSVTSKEGDEITCFTFSTNDNVERVCIKGGPDTNTYDDDPAGDKLCAPTNPGGQQAEISNVSFCGTGTKCVCYQVDLVWWKNSYPITEFSNDRYNENLIESYHDDICNDAGPETFNYDTVEVERDDCEVEISDIEWEVNESGDELTASFSLDCEDNANVQVGLVSYEAACEYPEGELTDMPLSSQSLVDSDSHTFGDGDGDLTVDLPV
jgi:hypothetical protein